MSETFKIETPHAAVMIWNYKNRLSSDPTNASKVNTIETYRISSGNCISIETTKTKGQPQGSFRMVVAPSTNWVSAITAGSWCCIFMSTEKLDFEKITQAGSVGKHKKNSLKMIGRIESVRVETQMDQSGTRRSLYYITGVDWGYVFNNSLYVDPAVAAVGDPQTQGNLLYVALRNLFIDKDGVRRLSTNDIISSLTKIFGFNTANINTAAASIGKLGKPVYEFKLPEELSTYLGLSAGPSVMSNLKFKFGTLKAYNKYTPITEALSLISVLSLQGQNNLWQVMLENSNPVLNEMFCEMEWEDGSDNPNLVLYKRIKPFSFKKSSQSTDITDQLRSYFQYVKRHDIESINIISANVGTNWRDKFNYAQVRFDTQGIGVLNNVVRRGLETFDEVAFQREGFRPLIESTRQIPIKPETNPKVQSVEFKPELGKYWVTLLREWYFDTHRMFNGTINMVGASDYIGVGNNIRFELDVVSPTQNMTEKVLKNPSRYYILAHVESVSHRFTVEPESGARTYTTSVQFSRGIIVDGDGNAIVQDQGIVLDDDVSLVPIEKDTNSKNTVPTSHDDDPSPFKGKK